MIKQKCEILEELLSLLWSNSEGVGMLPDMELYNVWVGSSCYWDLPSVIGEAGAETK